MTVGAWVTDLGRDLGRGLMHLVFPGLCHLCGQALEPGPASFCAPCRDGLLGDSLESCPRCAGTIGPFAKTDGGCVRCRNERFAFEAVVRLGPYDDPWRAGGLRMKHHSGEGLAELLREVWGEHRREGFPALA